MPSKQVAIGLMVSGIAVWIAIVVASGLGWSPFEKSWTFANTGAFGDSFGP